MSNYDSYCGMSEREESAWEKGFEAGHMAGARDVGKLEDILEACLEILENYEDLTDGDYGESVPNRAAIVAARIREYLE